MFQSLRWFLVLPALQAAKIYKCKWPRSVLSSGDPNLTVTLADASEVRCDRTGDASFLCPAACDYIRSEPFQCVGPIEDGDMCNTVWGASSLSYYKMTSYNDTHACTQRFNSDCSADMGGVFCQELQQCYGSYQEVGVAETSRAPNIAPKLNDPLSQHAEERDPGPSERSSSTSRPSWQSTVTSRVFCYSPSRSWSLRLATSLVLRMKGSLRKTRT